MNQITKVHASLFSGFGAAELAATWMGWDNAFWCEIEDFPRAVLSYWFPKSKGYGNIKETDFTPWRGKINVLTGGFPCQPFSVAGQRKGAADDRYLWPEMLRAIREIRPTWVIGENVGGIVSMVQSGSEVTVESQASLFEASDKETLLEQEYVVETVCSDLEQEGYSLQPIIIPACAIGAPHRRDRIFFIAHRLDTGTKGVQRERKDGVYQSEITSDPNGERCDNWGDNREKRSVYHDKKRNTQKDKPKWSERQCRACENGSATSNSQCTGSGQVQQEIQSEQSDGDSINSVGHEWNVTHANGQMLQEWFEAGGWSDKTKVRNGLDNGTHETRRNWRNFPTQPPVCRGNDGLPFDVVRLTVSLTAWCTGSVKGYGNAIVPQVMYEIFKAIEEVERLE